VVVLGARPNRVRDRRNTNGQILNVAARHKDGKWLMALANTTSFSIDLRKLTGAKRADAFWIDPGAVNHLGSETLFPPTSRASARRQAGRMPY
jgi:hypothetical protein